MTRPYITISEEFREVHPLPDTERWQDEALNYWPGLQKANGSFVYFYTYPEGGEWVPATYTRYEFDSATSFPTAEKTLHYGYTLFMLGCFQE